MHKSFLILAVVSVAVFLLFGAGISDSSAHHDIQVQSMVDASTGTSPHVVIFSTYPDSQYEVYVPLNSSGVSVFSCWEIYLYGSGSFTFTVNNSIVESGSVVNSIHIYYDWSLEKDNRTSGVLQFNGVDYSFNDFLSGPINDQVIESVFVSSTLKGQNQILAAESNVSGDLMYPTWKVQLQSTQVLNYSVYVKGKEITHGTILGSRNVTFNVSGASVSVQVILGQRTYTYPNELISSVPISRYYGPKPPTNTATFLDEVFAAVKGVFGLFPAMVLSYLGVKPLVIARKERTPVVW